VQTGTPEEIVTNPADDYVADFVAGISRLHLVTARSVMYPAAEFSVRYPDQELSRLPAVAETDDLDTLVEIMTDVDANRVAVTSNGRIAGVVTRRSLLRGIQGKPPERMNGQTPAGISTHTNKITA
jgi:glycine betaine/proline transport system ATP-binding protein